MNKPDFKELLNNYNQGRCSEEEKALIESWYTQFELDQLPDLTPKQLEEIWLSAPVTDRQVKKAPFWPRLTAAALILVTLSAGLYFSKIRDLVSGRNFSVAKNDIIPGGNKAILTLSNGKKIVLNDAKVGELDKQSGISISKTADGQLVYTAANLEAVPSNANIGYNTIETPRGGEYQVNLPDGSKVWLNAASVLKFPIEFTGNERRVEFSGEAYFEVAKNKKMPFIVVSNDMQVKVLGTHFNLMVYNDEKQANATLLEGSILLNSKFGDALLKPGQMAQLDRTKKSINISNPDTDDAIAWKNGYFIFFNEDIYSIMQKVSRWYNVEIAYQENINQSRIGGRFTRKKKLSELLNYLQKFGFHFKIEGRRVIVME